MALVQGTFGSIALISSLGKERVDALHGSDIVGLVAAGFCFGVAFTILITWYLERKEQKTAK